MALSSIGQENGFSAREAGFNSLKRHHNISLWRKGRRKRFRTVKLEVQVLSGIPLSECSEIGKHARFKPEVVSGFESLHSDQGK